MPLVLKLLKHRPILTCAAVYMGGLLMSADQCSVAVIFFQLLISSVAPARISAGVVNQPRLKRTVPWATSAVSPIARNVSDMFVCPLWQAAPVDAQTDGVAARRRCAARRSLRGNSATSSNTVLQNCHGCSSGTVLEETERFHPAASLKIQAKLLQILAL